MATTAMKIIPPETHAVPLLRHSPWSYRLWPIYSLLISAIGILTSNSQHCSSGLSYKEVETGGEEEVYSFCPT